MDERPWHVMLSSQQEPIDIFRRLAAFHEVTDGAFRYIGKPLMARTAV